MSSIDRLRKWADTWAGQRTVAAHKRDQDCSVTVATPSPVRFTHATVKVSLEEAAAECITALEAIGEEVPEA